MYIYERENWTDFRWDNEKILPTLASVRHLQGRLLGQMENLGFDLTEKATLESLILDVVDTSKIEGEFLNPELVRSSIARKLGIEQVKSIGKNVKWKNKARWVIDGKYYTSSGVSAGIDMSLGFVCDCFGEEIAIKIAQRIEYEWDNNKDNDIFGI